VRLPGEGGRAGPVDLAALVRTWTAALRAVQRALGLYDGLRTHETLERENVWLTGGVEAAADTLRLPPLGETERVFGELLRRQQGVVSALLALDTDLAHENTRIQACGRPLATGCADVGDAYRHTSTSCGSKQIT
jgi:hypothetical protein